MDEDGQMLQKFWCWIAFAKLQVTIKISLTGVIINLMPQNSGYRRSIDRDKEKGEKEKWKTLQDVDFYEDDTLEFYQLQCRKLELL